MEPLVTITRSMGGPAILLQQGVDHSKHLAPFKLLSIPVLHTHTHTEFPGNRAVLQGFQRVKCLLELQFPNHLESHKKVDLNSDPETKCVQILALLFLAV